MGQNQVITVIALIGLFASQGIADPIYCVKPESGSCPSMCTQCHTLNNYIKNSSQYFISNTKVLFLSGIHHASNPLYIENIANLSLVGSNDFVPQLEQCVSDERTLFNSSTEVHCLGAAGFTFTNASNLVIANITICNCGHYSLMGNAALALNSTYNLTISNVAIFYSNGYGLYVLGAWGSSLVNNSLFAFNSGTHNYSGGNSAFFYPNCLKINETSLLQIESSSFSYGQSYSGIYAAGLSVELTCADINVLINKTVLIENVADLYTESCGGNLAIVYNQTGVIENLVIVNNSYIVDGRAYKGGGMYLSLKERIDEPLTHNSPSTVSVTRKLVHISNTHFLDNHASYEGGGLYIRVTEGPIFDTLGQVIVMQCKFHNNSIPISSNGGVAVHVTNHNFPAYIPHEIPEYQIMFSGCQILDSYLTKVQSDHYLFLSGNAALFILQNPSGVSITDCTLEDNNCTAIAVIHSNVLFHGNITIQNNTGTNGGGLLMCDGSFIYLHPHTNITILHNHAHHSGGGIYAEHQCLQSEAACFFQPGLDLIQHSELLNTITIELKYNTAKYAGSDLYGGAVDSCFLRDAGPNRFTIPNVTERGLYIFDKIFKFVHLPSDMSYVTSDPLRVCFCNKGTMMPDCNATTGSREVFPGEKFCISAVVVGQRNGTVPGDIVAMFSDNYGASLDSLQNSQNINDTHCSLLHYTVFSNRSSATLILSAQRPQINSYGTTRVHYQPPQVKVTLKQCPLGFMLTQDQPHCDCIPVLTKDRIKCHINNHTIHRTTPTWIGYKYANKQTNERIIFHPHCPLDFCKLYDVDLDTSNDTIDQDNQCAFHRSGILCGKCKQGYSLVYGSSHCLPCSNFYLLSLVVFALAGLLLVFLLVLCNLTVAEGTIHGLIFYANIVQVNAAIFFQPLPSNLSSFLRILANVPVVFISWLNLDFGIEFCFYDGMDAYIKTWLQFAFPLYIWVIAGLIIYLSRKSTLVARMVGRNAVKVLATLFFLSYTKLQRTVIRALSPAVLIYSTTDGFSEHSKLVWLYDGNISYLRGKHIALFITAMIFGILLLIFTLILFTIQWLQMVSSRKLLFWVGKLKPLFDSYTGPYKCRYRFWMGFLLLVRFALFTTFAINVFGEPDLNLMVTGIACFTILMLAWVSGGIYKKWPMDVLEASFIFNLGVLSAVTGYILHNKGSQMATTMISVNTALATFIGILIYHAYKQQKSSHSIKYILSKCHRRLSSMQQPLLAEDNDGSSTDTNEYNSLEPVIAQQNRVLPTVANFPHFDRCREPVLEFEDN